MNDRPIEFFESLAERRLREAAERGEFDDLPGAGRPIPGLDGTYDPNWWVKEWIRRTSLEETVAGIRSTIRSDLPKLKASPDSPETAQRLAELNDMIEAANRELPTGQRLAQIEF